jgi:hypothetical protein
MKQTNYSLTRKRKMLGFRWQILAHRIERWLDEHYKQVFFWFAMICLFTGQLLVFLLPR